MQSPDGLSCAVPSTDITHKVCVIVIGAMATKREWLSVLDKYLGKMPAKVPKCLPLDVESTQM